MKKIFFLISIIAMFLLIISSVSSFKEPFVEIPIDSCSDITDCSFMENNGCTDSGTFFTCSDNQFLFMKNTNISTKNFSMKVDVEFTNVKANRFMFILDTGSCADTSANWLGMFLGSASGGFMPDRFLDQTQIPSEETSINTDFSHTVALGRKTVRVTYDITNFNYTYYNITNTSQFAQDASFNGTENGGGNVPDCISFMDNRGGSTQTDVIFYNVSLFEITPPQPDTTAPIIVATVINDTTPEFFEIISFTVSATDDTQLNRIEITDNRTGAFLNFTFVTVSGTSITSIFNISAQVGTIQLQATVTDIFENSAQSDLIILGIEGNQLRGNETGNLINWTGGVTSEEGNYVVDANNEFGQYTKKLVGDVVTNTNNWSILLDIAVDLTAGADKRIAEFWLDNTTHVDDTNLSFTIEILSNNSVQIINAQDATKNSIIEGLTDDGVFRQVSIVFLENQVQIINSSGELRANISLSAGFTDIISMNFGSQSEVSPNVRWDNFTIVNGTRLISGVEEQVLNIYTSSGDTQAPTIILIDPSSNVNNTRNNTIPLDIFFQVTDDSFNSIICNLDNSTILDTGTFIQGVDSDLTLAEGEITLDQTFLNLAIVCFDNTLLNNSASLLLNITLDSINPIIFPIAPPNGTRFNKDISSSINIRADCTDVPVFKFNITITNASDTIASFQSFTVVNNVITIDEQLSISNLGSGNYTVTHTCSDPHTKKSIPDYTVNKNSSNNKIKWTTPSGNEFELKYSVPMKNPIQTLDYGSSKSDDNSRYYFWYQLNATEDGTERDFNFELENRKFPLTYLPNSEFKGHFIMENNWFDFEFGDAEATYEITKNDNNNYEIIITTTKVLLNFTSVGELNTEVVTTTFEVFFIQQIVDFFVVTECKTDTGSAILLGLFMLISLFLITLGITSNVGFIGFFGSIALLFTSLRIVPCISALASILIFLSIVLMFFFIFRGFFSKSFSGLTGTGK